MLSGPYEIRELGDGEVWEFRVENWEVGEVVIHPRFPGAPAEKRIRTLRVYVPRAEKPAGMPYWDVTSQTLIAQLEPFLRTPDFRTRRFRVQAFGVAPRKRFTVTVF